MWKVNRNLCNSCGGCVAVCPANALNLNWDKIEVNDRCINCGICELMCPVGAITVKEEEKNVKQKI